MPATDIVEDTRTDQTTGSGGHDRFAHYVPKQQLERARAHGTSVVALCGKRWKPSADPSKFPMCPTCAEIVADRMADSLQ